MAGVFGWVNFSDMILPSLVFFIFSLFSLLFCGQQHSLLSLNEPLLCHVTKSREGNEPDIINRVTDEIWNIFRTNKVYVCSISTEQLSILIIQHIVSFHIWLLYKIYSIRSFICYFRLLSSFKKRILLAVIIA